MLSLAFVSTADYGLLPPLLRDFGARYPRRAARTDRGHERRADRRTGRRAHRRGPRRFRRCRRATRAALSYLPIAREPLVIACATARRCVATQLAAGRAPNGSTRRSACANSPPRRSSIFPRRLAPGFYDIIMGCYGAAGLTPRIGQEAIQMQTIVSLVSAGMGVALVPQSLRNLRRTGVVYRPLSESVPAIETGLVRRDEGSCWRAASNREPACSPGSSRIVRRPTAPRVSAAPSSRMQVRAVHSSRF